MGSGPKKFSRKQVGTKTGNVPLGTCKNFQKCDALRDLVAFVQF